MSNKLSKEQTAALIAGSNMSDYQIKQLRTACNKKLGQNPFASAHQVTQARREQLHCVTKILVHGIFQLIPLY